MHKHERSVSSDPELAAASRLDTPSADVYELMNQFVWDKMIKNHVREKKTEKTDILPDSVWVLLQKDMRRYSKKAGRHPPDL